MQGDIAADLAKRGYAVVLASLPLGPNREAGNPLNEMIDELLPQVYKAAELGYVDVNRLAIAGQSFGGYGTASIISGTNIFRAAVAVSGTVVEGNGLPVFRDGVTERRYGHGSFSHF